MQRASKCARFLLATSVFSLSVSAHGSETVAYSYDALGRLVATSSSGSVNNGVSTSLGYDPAGNRSSYGVSGAGGSAPPPPPPPPPPSPSNTAPVANADYFNVNQFQSAVINVVANDTDANGDYPLAIVSVSGANGYASKASATQVGWAGAPAGTYYVSYTIQDSRGATASGTLTVSVSSSDPCGGQICQ